MTGQLFTQYFLTEGIQETAAWQESVRNPQRFAAFRRSLSAILSGVNRANPPNEATAEQDIIRPIFALLAWRDYLPQQGSERNEDIPDHLLFADAEAKERANARQSSADRYQDALVIQESKRYGLPLDARDHQDRAQRGTPHGQILRYLSTAESASDGRIRWGILTNGAVWRLYDFRSRPRATGFYEADVQAMVEQGADDALRAFSLLFRRDAFTLREGATATFLEAAIAEGRRYEQRVAEDLSAVVFRRVFPDLVNALDSQRVAAFDSLRVAALDSQRVAALADRAAASAEADLAVVRHAALIFLYRLLFLLYAEDRGLLPVNDPRYDDYGLRKRVRDDVAARMALRDTFSSVATNYYDRLATLFRLIDQGDPSIGLPPYNGGLFAPESAPLLDHVRLSDNVVAGIIYDLSHTRSAAKGATTRSFVNYRDLSVQQLGSIYERLLEQAPVRGDDGRIAMRPNPYARKDSGSFYTPQELVDLIVEKTLEPLVEERLQAFEAKAAQLKRDRRAKAERLQELHTLDPAVAALNLKILDPAMGSGHFLVTAVDFLSDYIADVVEYVPGVPDWLDNDGGGVYVSPLVGRIARIRQEILDRARESQWTLDASQLTDQAIIRRMVLKRCIYGVDKNPLAVELAKVSLWLHSFTVGAPLSFLDHHLRCGDSLLGLRVTEGVAELNRVAGLGAQSAIAGAEAAAEGMARIEMLSDADVTEVRESAALFAGVEETTADLRSLLDVLCGLRWLTAGMKKQERTLFEAPLFELLRQQPQDAFKLLAHGPDIDEAHDPDAIRHSGAHSDRHSRESGNPSSPQPMDSRIHGSDDQDPAASSGSAGLQPASMSASETPNPIHNSGADSDRHSRESGNPSSPPPMDSRFHGSDDQNPTAPSGSAGLEPASMSASETPNSIHNSGADSDRHSRESGNPSSPPPMDSRFHGSDDQDPAAPSGSAGSHETCAQPASASETPNPIRHSRESGNPSSSASLDSGLRRSDESRSLASEFTTLWRRARAIADRETFLHWEAAFPGVWEQWQDAHPQGGFDAVIGNPPWGRIKLQEVKWFEIRAPAIARAPTAAARRAAIKELRMQDDPLAPAFDNAKARADSLSRLVRSSGHYPLLGGGDVDLYALFVERALCLVNAQGLVGLLTPDSIYTGKTAAKFFKSISTSGRLSGLFDFENKKVFFKDVHASKKFCALIVGGVERRFHETACAFFLHDTKTIADPDRCFPLVPADFARVNPNTGTAPIFRTHRDAAVTRAVYARHPVLVDRSGGDERKTWPVKYHTMFHMANDSHLFRTATELEDEGFYPVQGNSWRRGKERYLPLYEGKMVQAFDHRAASIVTHTGNLFRSGQPDRTLDEERLDTSFSPRSRYWISQQGSNIAISADWLLVFKDITAPTNIRTMIAAMVPQVGCGHTLPILIPDEDGFDAGSAGCLLANLNSFCLDFVARQKVGTHLTWYTVEQLPVIAPAAYDRKFGRTTARELVRDHVLKLTYTAHDMAPFARDLGYTGPPFIWNAEERRHLRARLDALYFHLYGIDREDAAYILSTFLNVQRQDQAAFGTYRTHNLIRAYMNALSAGDTETVVNL